MIPLSPEALTAKVSSPRTRGDDPIVIDSFTAAEDFSPHPRG